jgi:sirohydrochlorin cobaltochelatase
MSDARLPVRQVLLLAAHGSSTDARAREQVQLHAARIKALVPHEITVTGFARGTPVIADAMAAAMADADARPTVVTVVPFMTSAGHYARTVLPARLRDALVEQRAESVRISITKPVGASRRIVAVLHRRALRLAAREGWLPRDVVLVLVGHGTTRQPTSRDTALAHARRLATLGWSAAHAAFIDDEPQIATVVSAIAATRVIVLPFLIGGAAHHLVDIPVALGFPPIDTSADALCDAPGAALTVGGRRLLLDAPIGADAALSDIAVSLAARAWQRVAVARLAHTPAVTWPPRAAARGRRVARPTCAISVAGACAA